MKKHIGIIKVSFVLLLASVLLAVAIIAIPAEAKTTVSQTFVLPSSSTITHTADTYIILWEAATGNLVNDAGTIAVANTWTQGDIETTVHNENGTVYTSTIPALDTTKVYSIAVYSNAAPAKTDVPTMGPFYYDPQTNRVYTDTNPIVTTETGQQTRSTDKAEKY